MILMYNEIPAHKGNNLCKTHQDDAGYDIKSGENGIIQPMTSRAFKTGLHIYFEPHLQMIIKSRSGLAVEHDIEASNAGLIDSGYTGEIKVKLYNHSPNQLFEVSQGQRIAQAVFSFRPEGFMEFLEDCYWAFIGVESMGKDKPFIKEVESLSDLPESARGTNGFGSSGR